MSSVWRHVSAHMVDGVPVAPVFNAKTGSAKTCAGKY